jgi:cytochrome c-type biogenesis protein CcmH
VTGWILLVLIAGAVFVALLRFGKLPRRSWESLAAALVLGMAGYALQGRPGLPDAPAQPSLSKGKEAAAFIEMRSAMDQNYGPAKRWLITADSFARTGDYALSAGYIKAGLRVSPNDPDLWSALGVQLMLASEGRMSAPAKYAFDRARKLSPSQPAPDYFEGLAALFEGRVVDTLKIWQHLLDTAPKYARWQPLLQSQVDGLTTTAEKLSKQETQISPSN